MLAPQRTAMHLVMERVRTLNIPISWKELYSLVLEDTLSELDSLNSKAPFYGNEQKPTRTIQ